MTAADPLLLRLRHALAGAAGQSGGDGMVPAGAPTPAAVLIPVVVRDSGPTVLLTKRTAHLNDHAGQISFPGGRCEPDDRDRIHTALRESHEEVGLAVEQIEVIGTLPEYLTGTGFCVTPVVGLVTPPLNLALDDFEVAEAFEVPLSWLMTAAHWRRDTLEWQGRQRQYWAADWRDYYIWGATAGMLVNLMELLQKKEQES